MYRRVDIRLVSEFYSLQMTHTTSIRDIKNCVFVAEKFDKPNYVDPTLQQNNDGASTTVPLKTLHKAKKQIQAIMS